MGKESFLIILALFFGIHINILNAQTICEGRKISPVVTFDICNYDPWVLVFEDNFDGTNLDMSKWEEAGWGTLSTENSQEYNSLNNVIVSEGTLKIIARKETVLRRAIPWLPDDEILDDNLANLRTYSYTSSSIKTQSTFSYGKYEARIKIPKGKGFWPAFWTYSANPWNEIDIFEFWNETTAQGYYDPSKLSKIHNMTVHNDYDNDGTHRQCLTDYTGTDFSQDFHTFTMIWEKDKIEWLVDGVLKRTDYRYYTILGQVAGCTIEASHYYIMNIIYPGNPMAVYLNFAIQSGKNKKGEENSPDNTTPFPSQMEVDWFRYYQRNSCDQNINVTNNSQYPLEYDVFNVIMGKNVSINCNYTVQTGQHLEIIAQEGITLGAGFNTELGATFTARINPDMCQQNHRSDNNIEDTLNLKRDIQTIENNEMIFSPNLNNDSTSVNIENIGYANRNGDINIFPSPSDVSFTIDFGSVKYANFKIALTNIDGELVYSLDKIHSSCVTINIKDNPNGIYILYLFDELEQNIITHKIIIQQ